MTSNHVTIELKVQVLQYNQMSNFSTFYNMVNFNFQLLICIILKSPTGSFRFFHLSYYNNIVWTKLPRIKLCNFNFFNICPTSDTNI